jgi:chemotaxis protein histidine kinase CheA
MPTDVDNELLQRFRSVVGERLSRIGQNIERLVKVPDDAGMLREVAREIHIVKGDAKMYGFDSIHAGANNLERYLERAEADRFASNSAAVKLLRTSIGVAQRLLEERPSSRGLPSETLRDGHGDETEALGVRPDGRPWRILLIDDSEMALEMQRRVLKRARFDVRATTTLEAFD